MGSHRHEGTRGAESADRTRRGPGGQQTGRHHPQARWTREAQVTGQGRCSCLLLSRRRCQPHVRVRSVAQWGPTLRPHGL